MYRLVSNDNVSLDQWWEFTDSNQLASVFHTPYFHQIFEGMANYKPFVIFAIDGEDKIVGMLNGFIQQMVPILPSCMSSRGVVMQSPLFVNKDVLQSLISGYNRQFGHKVLYTEIRSHTSMSEYSSIMMNHKYKHEEHLNILVDLTQSEEVLWRQVHQKRRNEIRKAKKNGLEFRKLDNYELLSAYNILKEVYTRARLPLMGVDFFYRCANYSNSKCKLVMYGTFYNNELIGTMFTLQYKKTIYDYYAGSYAAYYHMNPNDLIPWEVFLDGKLNGFEVFDFGGAGNPKTPYGVRNYKMKFGGILVNYGRYKYTRYNLLYELFELSLKLCR